MTEPKKDYNPNDYKPETIVTKKSGWRTFFIIIGVIAVAFFLLIIGVIVALLVIKPYGLDVTKLPAAIGNMSSDAPSSYDHPLLSTEQEKLLDSFGIDPATVPTSITPAQEACAVSALGSARVNEIKAGANPTLSDYLKAQDCF